MPPVTSGRAATEDALAPRNDELGGAGAAPDFVLDTFGQWTDSSDGMVAPTVCCCFRQ